MTEDGDPSDVTYDIGFRDGIKFVITNVLAAAAIAQERRQTYYATKLRELAEELERQIAQ